MGMNIMRMKGRAKMMRTIKVTGKGKIAVKPDMIRLYVNKEELCTEYEDTLRRSTEDIELGKLCISVHKGATRKTDGIDWM